MLEEMEEDIKMVLDHDPAARSKKEIFFCYPGIHALWFHRRIHWLWNMNFKLTARWLSNLNRFLTGIEIHPAVKVGKKVFIDHGMGVVIGETVEIGNNVLIYHGVTLGGVSLAKGKRHPTIEDDVIIGAGAKVLGNVVLGKGCIIGANSVVLKSVPAYTVVVGVPAQIIKRSKPVDDTMDKEDKDTMPDAFGVSITSVLQRLEKLESILDKELKEQKLCQKEKEEEIHKIRPPVKGVWKGEDFMI
jgi:serine O-acetyltransferase